MIEKRSTELVLADDVKVDAMIFINEEKRIVVAVAQNMEHLAMFVLSRFLSRSEDQLNVMPSISEELNDKLLMNKAYRGYAVCVPEDTWDEEIGINLATARLRQKLELAVHDKLHPIVDEVYKMHSMLDDFHDKYQNAGLDEPVDHD